MQLQLHRGLYRDLKLSSCACQFVSVLPPHRSQPPCTIMRVQVADEVEAWRCYQRQHSALLPSRLIGTSRARNEGLATSRAQDNAKRLPQLAAIVQLSRFTRSSSLRQPSPDLYASGARCFSSTRPHTCLPQQQLLLLLLSSSFATPVVPQSLSLRSLPLRLHLFYIIHPAGHCLLLHNRRSLSDELPLWTRSSRT